MWSLGNEPGTEHFPQSAYDYWMPLYRLAHQADPQNRPVTLVGCQNDYTRDLIIPAMDVVCINRYDGWYNLSGDLDAAKYAFRMELDWWDQVGKPLILSEYAADTINGLHGVVAEMFTEEFQIDYYAAMNECPDERPYVIGELPWNYADFGTQPSPMRSGGNRKGLFTRDRKPKMVAHYFRQRWKNFQKQSKQKTPARPAASRQRRCLSLSVLPVAHILPRRQPHLLLEGGGEVILIPEPAHDRDIVQGHSILV